jgi:membrane protease YdiL (CAAX protease family)
LVVVVLLLFAVVATWPLATSAVEGLAWPMRIVVHLSPLLLMMGIVAASARWDRMRLVTAIRFSTEHLARQMLTAVALAALTLGLTLWPALFGVNVMGDGETRPWVFLYLALRTFFLVGFVEEFVWRGYVLGGTLRAVRSGPWAVVISSLIFGLWHFPANQDFLQVFVTALIGAIYATAMLKVRHCSTLATGTAHGLHDLTLLVLASLMA